MTLEEVQELLLQEQEKNKELNAKYEKVQEDTQKLIEDNKRLTDYNNKLFMRLTEPVAEAQKEEALTAEELEAREINNIRELMKNRRV